MKKNPGRKERRILERQNRRNAGRTIAVMNERRQKANTRKNGTSFKFLCRRFNGVVL